MLILFIDADNDNVPTQLESIELVVVPDVDLATFYSDDESGNAIASPMMRLHERSGDNDDKDDDNA
jgi:hypothetical protein